MQSEHNELISVAMGVRYRRPNLVPLERAIRSILTQTYSNLELLICQNDSTSEACYLLNMLATEDPRIQLVEGAGAKTLAEKLNRCIAVAHGDWLARMDDDDYSDPERLACQMDYLSNHSNLTFVGCLVRLEQSGKVLRSPQLPEYPVVRDFLFVQPFIHPTLIFRKEALIAINGYCEERRCAGCEDYDLLLRLYEKGYVGANLQAVYFSYTIPATGQSNRTFSMRMNEVKTRQGLFARLGLLPKAYPYVLKPLVAAFIPKRLLFKIKSFWYRKKEKHNFE